MKIIELLNKIANDEELPEKILYSNKIWYWDNIEDDYVEDNKRLFNYYLDECLISCLNDEIEIIEEDKKIEKIEDLNSDYYVKARDCMGFTKEIALDIKTTKDKINEIIGYLNKENE